MDEFNFLREPKITRNYQLKKTEFEKFVIICSRMDIPCAKVVRKLIKKFIEENEEKYLNKKK